MLSLRATSWKKITIDKFVSVKCSYKKEAIPMNIDTTYRNIDEVWTIRKNNRRGSTQYRKRKYNKYKYCQVESTVRVNTGTVTSAFEVDS